MKRWLIICFTLLFMGKVVEQPITEPVKPVELTIEQKVEALKVAELIKKPQEQWVIGKKTVAYYQDVELPDGSKVELKSRTSLTNEQWLEKAKEIYKAQLEAEKLEEVRICPCCGRPL